MMRGPHFGKKIDQHRVAQRPPRRTRPMSAAVARPGIDKHVTPHNTHGIATGQAGTPPCRGTVVGAAGPSPACATSRRALLPKQGTTDGTQQPAEKALEPK